MMGSTQLPRLDLLIRRVANQDTSALAELIELTHDNTIWFLKCRAPDLPPEEIECIYAKVITKVWFNASSFTGKSRVSSEPARAARAWLSTIARNELTDYHRIESYLRQHEFLESDMPPDPDDPDNEHSLFDRLSDPIPDAEHVLIESQGFEEFLAVLTPVEQRIFDLRLAGLSQKDIAKELHITPPAVSQHVGKMKAKAQACLDWPD